MLQTVGNRRRRYDIARGAPRTNSACRASSAQPPRVSGTRSLRRGRSSFDGGECKRRQGTREKLGRGSHGESQDERAIRARYARSRRVSKIKPAIEGGTDRGAGTRCQFSDGASACVVMDREGSPRSAPEAARDLPRLRGSRLRAGRNGHRPGFRGAGDCLRARA